MIRKIAFYSEYDLLLFENKFLKDKNNYYVYLKNHLQNRGYEVQTLDTYRRLGLKADVCLVFDLPPKGVTSNLRKHSKSFVGILREPQIICEANYLPRNMKSVDVLLSWKSELINSKQALPYPSTRFNLNDYAKVDQVYNRKLCTLINSNLSSSKRGELYSERLKAIKWFEQNHPEDFDLYGRGWDKGQINIMGKQINLKLLASARPSYRGVSISKIDTLKKYKFSICYENTNLEDGYISEKIFDGFLGNTIPIYLGPYDTNNFIPSKCFINKRDFKEYSDLYKYIKQITDSEYETYLKNIENFLLENHKQYSYFSWAESIIQGIVKAEKNLNNS